LWDIQPILRSKVIIFIMNSEVIPIPRFNYMFRIQSHIRGAFNMDDKHSHKPHEIYYLRKGQRYYFIDDRIYHVHQGDLIFVPSFVLHRTTAADNRDHERTVVYFQDRFLEDLIPDIVAHPIMNRFYSEPKVVRLKLADQIVVENILSKLSLEYQKPQPNSELYLKILLIELLLVATRIGTADSSVYEPLSPVHEKIHKIVRYLRTNYQRPFSLKQLAAQFYISQCYLSRMFKAVTGLTLIEYLNTIRIQEAKKLLADEGLTITEIADMVGYESQTYFGRMFKRITGLSPREYRKQHGAGHH